MALLNRRRKPSGADRPPNPTPPSAEPAAGLPGYAESVDTGESREDDGIIRASTLADVPEWQKVPPPAPLLPDMPLVVSTHFEDSLVARQPPERFLAPLAHAISSEAPSGLIEGLSLVTEVPDVAAPASAAALSADEPLPLAVPPAAESSGTKRTPTTSVRRLEWSTPEPESTAEHTPDPSLIADASPEPTRDPGPGSSPQAVETAAITESAANSLDDHDGTHLGASSGLVGSAPLEPAVRPMVAQLMPEEPLKAYTQAPSPADMPLAHLPSERLPEDERREPPARAAAESDTGFRGPSTGAPLASAQATPADGSDTAAVAAPPADTGSSALVGDRPLLSGPRPDGGPDAGAGMPAATDSDDGAAASDLPLATGMVGPRSSEPETVVRRLVDDEPVDGGPSAGAMGEQAPLPPPESPGAGGQDSAAGSAAPSAPIPPDPERPPSVAPLVGETPAITEGSAPLVAPVGPPEPEAGAGLEQPLVTNRPANRPRSGLGAPIPSLPPSARSWDLTSMSHEEQLRASRSMIQTALASTNRPGSPGQMTLASTEPLSMPLAAPASRSAEPATVGAAAGLPVARLQRLSEPPSGVLPDDLPPAGDEAAPLLSDAPSMFDEPPQGAVSASPETTEGARARQEVGRRHGVDLSTVRVDRSQEGASAATQLRARAFTTASGVVIPRQEGTLETGPGEALLAHELTHVAQRMRLGPNVPDESSAAGRVLEQEAASTELTFNTGGRPPAGLAPPNGSLGGPVAGTRSAEALPLAAPVAPGPDTDVLAASILEKLSSLGTGPATAPPAAESVSTTWTSSVPSVAGAGAVQRAATDTAPPQTAAQATSGVAGSTGGTLSGSERPSDQELANLTKWLYPLIKHRLKGDLREDRERAGLLTDHYRKW